MLKSDVASRLSKEFGDASSDTDLIALFNNWIDEAYQTIAGYFRWQHQKGFINVDTAIGINFIGLDPNVRRVINIRDTVNLRPIVYRTFKDITMDGLETDSQGQVIWWYYGDYSVTDTDRHVVIKFVYVPDTIITLELEVEKIAPEQIASNEHIPLPSELLPALSCCVRELSALHEDKADMAANWKNKYEGIILQYKANLEDNQADPVINRENTDLWYGSHSVKPFLRYPEHITEV